MQFHMKSVVYKYISPSGKIYIGQTNNEELRRSKFLDKDSSYAGSRIQKERQIFSDFSLWDYEVLKEIEDGDRNKLDFWEAYYILKYNSIEQGLNCDFGNSKTLAYNGQFKEFYLNADEETKSKILWCIKEPSVEREHFPRITLNTFWKNEVKKRDLLLLREFKLQKLGEIDYKISHAKTQSSADSYKKRKEGYISLIKGIDEELENLK